MLLLWQCVISPKLLTESLSLNGQLKRMSDNKFIPQERKTKALEVSAKALNLEPVRYDDPVELENRINLYFSQCAENGLFPSVTGLSLFLGIDRVTLWTWKTANRRGSDHRYTEIIQRAYAVIEESMIQEMLHGNVKNPISAIFYLKNLHGYRDEPEKPSEKYELPSDKKMAEIAERYNIVDIDIVNEKDE